MAPERLLSTRHVAELLDTDIRTVQRRVAEGELRWTNIAPKGKRASIRIPESALVEYQQQRARGGVA
jgi:excisionase family DNA binding protein